MTGWTTCSPDRMRSSGQRSRPDQPRLVIRWGSGWVRWCRCVRPGWSSGRCRRGADRRPAGVLLETVVVAAFGAGVAQAGPAACLVRDVVLEVALARRAAGRPGWCRWRAGPGTGACSLTPGSWRRASYRWSQSSGGRAVSIATIRSGPAAGGAQPPGAVSAGRAVPAGRGEAEPGPARRAGARRVWRGSLGSGRAQPWPMAWPCASVTVTHQVVFGFRAAAAARSRASHGSTGPSPASSPGRSARPASGAQRDGQRDPAGEPARGTRAGPPGGWRAAAGHRPPAPRPPRPRGAGPGVLAEEQVEVGAGAQLVHPAVQPGPLQLVRPGGDPLVRGQHLVRAAARGPSARRCRYPRPTAPPARTSPRSPAAAAPSPGRPRSPRGRSRRAARPGSAGRPGPAPWPRPPELRPASRSAVSRTISSALGRVIVPSYSASCVPPSRVSRWHATVSRPVRRGPGLAQRAGQLVPGELLRHAGIAPAPARSRPRGYAGTAPRSRPACGRRRGPRPGPSAHTSPTSSSSATPSNASPVRRRPRRRRRPPPGPRSPAARPAPSRAEPGRPAGPTRPGRPAPSRRWPGPRRPVVAASTAEQVASAAASRISASSCPSARPDRRRRRLGSRTPPSSDGSSSWSRHSRSSQASRSAAVIGSGRDQAGSSSHSGSAGTGSGDMYHHPFGMMIYIEHDSVL